MSRETEDSASVSRRQRSNFDVIPQFYFPSGSAMSSNRGRSNSFTSSASGANGSSEEYMKKQADIEAFFKPYPGTHTYILTHIHTYIHTYMH